MLGENIKILRKQKGYSQETLASQLNVVRQTVSKWEKGLSVPDAEMLNSLSELLETPVSTLLGATVSEDEAPPTSEMSEVAKQLAILNDRLANNAAKKRKTIKRIIICLLIAALLLIILWAACYYFFRVVPRENAVMKTTQIECTLNGETYAYEFTYDQNFQIYEGGGDGWIAAHIPEAFESGDANVALAQIEDYFTDRGGTVKITDVVVPGDG